MSGEAMSFLVFVAVCAVIGLAGEWIVRKLRERKPRQPKVEVFRYTDRGIRKV